MLPPLLPWRLLQSLKDGIVVMEMGADALPFLTTLGTLPASLAYFNFYRFTLVRQQHVLCAVTTDSNADTKGFAPRFCAQQLVVRQDSSSSSSRQASTPVAYPLMCTGK